jgi:hypothetical protein
MVDVERLLRSFNLGWLPSGIYIKEALQILVQPNVVYHILDRVTTWI